jgi:hypothetical protein
VEPFGLKPFPPPTEVIDPLVAAEFVTVPVPKTELLPLVAAPDTLVPPAPTVTVYEVPPVIT